LDAGGESGISSTLRQGRWERGGEDLPKSSNPPDAAGAGGAEEEGLLKKSASSPTSLAPGTSDDARKDEPRAAFSLARKSAIGSSDIVDECIGGGRQGV
jgi:hypothetical protein